MTEIKICGITNREDALFAAEAGADALGFIFTPQSPRFVTPEQASAIIAALPSRVIRIGVFVNQDYDEIERIRTCCPLDMVQLHGDEPPEFCRRFPLPAVIKAFSPRTEEDVGGLERYPPTAVLVDARGSGRYGGTGMTADWNLARLVKAIRPLILSGGLHQDNIGEALRSVSPAAVDVNSGVETEPGKKDHGKIAAVIDLVRRGDGSGQRTGTRIFHAARRRQYGG